MKTLLLLLLPLTMFGQAPHVTHQKLFRDTVGGCVSVGGSQDNNIAALDTVYLGDTVFIAYKCPPFVVTNSYDYLVFYAYPILNYTDTLKRIKIPYNAFIQTPVCGNIEGETADLFKIKFAIPDIIAMLDPSGRMIVRLPFSNQPEYNAVTVINGNPTGMLPELIGTGKVIRTAYYTILGQPINKPTITPSIMEIVIKAEFYENGACKRSKIIVTQ